MAYLRLGQPEEALADFTKAIALAPKYAPSWSNRGLAYVRLGQPGKAAADRAKAIEVDPILNPILKQASRLRRVRYSRLGQQILRHTLREKAVADCTKAIELSPKDARLWNNRGEAYLTIHLDQAIADFAKAIELDPKFKDAWHDRSGAHAVLGKWQRAAAEFAQATERFPGDLELWCAYACTLLLAGDAEGYRRVCAEVLHANAQATDPQTGYVLARMVSLAPGTADRAQAVAWAQKAVAANPRRAWYLHTMGVAHYRAGQFDQAVRRLEQSQQDDPAWQGHIIDWLLLAMAHQRLERPVDARAWLDRARQWKDQAKKDLAKGAPYWPVDGWCDRLEIELLDREAEQLFRLDKKK
jgi:tetratricopeptide (TPR) repeat protein